MQVDAQLRGAAGLAHQKGGHSGVLDLAHDPADRLVVDLGDVQDVLLRLLHLPQLDHTQDDVELVDELVGIGPHGLHQMAHAGELLRHGGGLGAVLEDGHRAHDLVVLPDGHPVGQGGLAAGNVLEVDVVFRLSGGEQAGQQGIGIELLQRPAQYVGGLLRVEKAQARGVDIDHICVLVDGDDALLQGLQNVLALVEHLAEGVRLIAQQGLLDGAGQIAGQHQGDAGGQESQDGEATHGVQHDLVDAAHPDAHGYKAQQGAVQIMDRGEGAVLRAGDAGACVHLGQLPTQDRERIHIRVDRPHKGGVRAVPDDAVVVGHHDGVNVLDPGDGPVQVVGEHRAVRPVGQKIGHIRRLGQHLGGIHQVAVQVLILHAQGEQQGGGHAQDRGGQDQEQAEGLQLMADRYG